ncbi:MAG: hypothetical protein KGJ35_03080 [Patescibacteria group bacterium]|nr:hypothetical protein [Patescibacteria group bacterium]
MNIFAISGLINGIVATTFGLLVISKNLKERSNQVYFLMTLSLAVWSFGYWQWQITTDYSLALFWVRLLSVGSLFIPVFFLHWCTLLIGKNKVNNVVIILSYILIGFTLFFVNSPLFIAHLEHESIFPLWPIAGRVYDIYFSYQYFGVIVFAMYFLFRSYFSEHNLQKRGQILYIIIGSLLGFGGGLTNFPLWFDIQILPYGNFLVAAFPFFLGYSVLRYKLFNAKTIATEILVFFISIILLVDATLSVSIIEAILKTSVFAVVSIFGYLLIRSVYREVAQREKIETLAKNLEAANERLRELDKQKTEFISFATHQLRAPLTAIKGYASLLDEGELGRLPPEAGKAVNRIYESASTMVNVVEDYLNVSRIELGTMKYNFQPLDMKTMVEEVIAELRPNIAKSRLDFDYKPAGEGPWTVSADPDKMKQVIGNIIDNSVKYTPKGFVHVTLERVHETDGSIPVKFTVSDSGIGIAPEVMPKLFQKFSRAEGANKQNIHGTGLGLFIVKDIVNAHKGKVWAESAGEGQGSKFIVELPVTSYVQHS